MKQASSRILVLAALVIGMTMPVTNAFDQFQAIILPPTHPMPGSVTGTDPVPPPPSLR